MYTARQVELGTKVRKLLADKGYVSVAAPGFEATSIVVMYATAPEQANGSAFKQAGVQIASGVPLQVGEPEGFPPSASVCSAWTSGAMSTAPSRGSPRRWTRLSLPSRRSTNTVSRLPWAGCAALPRWACRFSQGRGFHL